jgi:hypothetical protein
MRWTSEPRRKVDLKITLDGVIAVRSHEERSDLLLDFEACCIAFRVPPDLKQNMRCTTINQFYHSLFTCKQGVGEHGLNNNWAGGQLGMWWLNSFAGNFWPCDLDWKVCALFFLLFFLKKGKTRAVLLATYKITHTMMILMVLTFYYTRQFLFM